MPELYDSVQFYPNFFFSTKGMKLFHLQGNGDICWFVFHKRTTIYTISKQSEVLENVITVIYLLKVYAAHFLVQPDWVTSNI